MDGMYRYQRYFYNATRKYYLLGRDRLLRELPIRAGDNILELGCGTARNLIILAERHPEANFFGLDASSAMLETARAQIEARKLKNLTLKTALADDFDFQRTFRLSRPFDAAFFSYSISMIPTWKRSLAQALANLSPDGRLYLVDFYDQAELPVWFRRALTNWLKKFHVQFWEELLPYLANWETKGIGKLQVSPIARRYAFLAKFERCV